MHQFIANHQEQLVGVLSGFDRVVFRGTLRPIAYAEGLKRYLRATHVLLKDFGRHVAEVSDRLKEASVAQARALGRPVRYLPSSRTDKDALARRIMAASPGFWAQRQQQIEQCRSTPETCPQRPRAAAGVVS